MSKRPSIIILLALSLLIVLSNVSRAEDSNRAAVVVALGDGAVAARCVSFSEPEISGIDLLERSGLNVILEDQAAGAAVCSIEGTGCPADDCFCQCKGGGQCVYWSYWHRQNETWNYSAAGSSIYKISDGMVDGWSWGPSTVSQAIPPPDLSFGDVCEVTQDPTITPTPSATAPPIVIPGPAEATVTPVNSAPTATVGPTETSQATPHSTTVGANATPAAGATTESAVTPSSSQAAPGPYGDLEAEATRSPQAAGISAAEVLPTVDSQVIAPSTAATATSAAYPAPFSPDVPVAEPPVIVGPTPTPAVAAPAPEQVAADAGVPQPEAAAVAVIGAGVVPAAEHQAPATEPDAQPSRESAADWPSYAAFALMLLALGALAGLARVRAGARSGGH